MTGRLQRDAASSSFDHSFSLFAQSQLHSAAPACTKWPNQKKMDSYFWERSASLPHWMSLSSLFEEVGGGEPREEDEGEEEKVFLIWSKVFSSFGQKRKPEIFFYQALSLFTSDKTYDKTATFFQCWGITWRASVHFPLHEPCSLWPFLPWRHTSHPLHSALKLENLCKNMCVFQRLYHYLKEAKIIFLKT